MSTSTSTLTSEGRKEDRENKTSHRISQSIQYIGLYIEIHIQVRVNIEYEDRLPHDLAGVDGGERTKRRTDARHAGDGTETWVDLIEHMPCLCLLCSACSTIIGRTAGNIGPFGCGSTNWQ